MRQEELKNNLEDVERRVAEACKRAGRDRSEVTLIAVSKTMPVEDLQVIYDAGIREFGENKVQELTGKIPEMPTDINWHLIGHLQRNKVKYIVDKVKLIHSVDSYRLAEEINIQAKKHGVIVPILIEVNVANEASKFGVKYEEAKQYYTLWKFMIDQRYQNKGYGRQALLQGLDFIKEKFNPDRIYTGVALGNHVAKELYESVGFVDTVSSETDISTV